MLKYPIHVEKMSRRTTRSRAAATAEPLLTLEDVSKPITTNKLTDDQKDRLRIFVNAYLMKQGKPVETAEIVEFLKNNCIGSSVKKEYQVICDIYNSGVPLNKITTLVSNYITKILKRDVSIQAMFPEGNVRVTVYKQMTYKEFIKYFQNDLSKVTEDAKEEFAIALNDPNSIMFQSVLKLVEEGTPIAQKKVTDIVENIPGFDINTNKDGRTLFIVTVLRLNDYLKEDDLAGANRVLNLLKILAQNPSINPTIAVNNMKCQLDTTGKPSTITITPLFLMYYIIQYYQDRLNPNVVKKTYTDIINPLIETFKMPAFYLTENKCPGKCYGYIKKEGIKPIVIDNLWFAMSFDKEYLQYLINEAGYDKKQGRDNKTVGRTFEVMNDSLKAEVRRMEAQSTAIDEQLQSAREQLSALRSIVINIEMKQRESKYNLLNKQKRYRDMTNVYTELTNDGII